ncbi:hypothetical protein INR49_028929 [Caranx melampygus]|nr:hypothetical protein INR49_028929 [Caranx melampygus]
MSSRTEVPSFTNDSDSAAPMTENYLSCFASQPLLQHLIRIMVFTLHPLHKNSWILHYISSCSLLSTNHPICLLRLQLMQV